MAQLSEDQHNQIELLLAHLNTFPTPELIATSGDLRASRPLDDVGKARIRQSLAGAYAMEKIGYYMHTLRMVDAERHRVGYQTHLLRERAQQLQDTDSESAVTAQVHASASSGLQEVTYHLFVICVMAIDGLLPLAERATGYKIPKEDRAVLQSYKVLRDFFEHMENRTPGKSHQAEFVTEHQDEYLWQVVMGFEVDGEDRIVIKGHRIDVTTRGLHAVEDVLARNYLAMRASCLQQVRDYFIQNPSDTPNPAQIRYAPLVSVFSASEQVFDGK